MLGGAPVSSDVSGCVQVRVFRVLALLASKTFAAGSVLLGRVPALRAPLRGVTSVHEYNSDAVFGSLVGHHVLLPSERPGVHPSSGVRPETGGAKSDVRQVFQGQRRASRQRVQYVLGDVVVTPEPEPLPPSAASLEATFGGTCAFGLETALRSEVSSVHLMPVGVADYLAVRERSRNHNSSVATNHTCRCLWFFSLLGKRERKPPPALFVTRQLAAVGVPSIVLFDATVFLDDESDPLAVRGDGHDPPVGPNGHRVGVVGYGQNLRVGTRRLLSFGYPRPCRSNVAHGQTLDVANELRLQVVAAPQVAVDGMVELDCSLDLGMRPSKGCRLVVGSGDATLKIKQAAHGLSRDLHLNSHRPCHLHLAHVCRTCHGGCQERIAPPLREQRGFRDLAKETIGCLR